jgi:hypothetical protein
MKESDPLNAPPQPEITPDIKGFYSTLWWKYFEISPVLMLRDMPLTFTVSITWKKVAWNISIAQ